MSAADDKPPARGGLFKRLFGGGKPSAEPSVADADANPALALEAAVAPGEAEAAPVAPPAAAPKGWFQRLKEGLGKTQSKLTQGINSLFNKRKLDKATLEDLEDLLLESDLGIATASRITQAIAKGRFDKGLSPEEVREILAHEVERVLEPVARPLIVNPALKPHVILVVGVNGTGKTTTIGKLSAQFREQGHQVVLAAGDTFRAAAVAQLKVWGERTGALVIAGKDGADASGLAFEALQTAQAEQAGVLLIDSAGRLQNKQALMQELEKVIRVIRKLDASAPHDVLLVIDATTGQNALSQVEVFRERAGVTGLILTKLDGTARGGIIVAIAERFGLPVHAIGVGEGVLDLQPFKARDFAQALSGHQTLSGPEVVSRKLGD